MLRKVYRHKKKSGCGSLKSFSKMSQEEFDWHLWIRYFQIIINLWMYVYNYLLVVKEIFSYGTGRKRKIEETRIVQIISLRDSSTIFAQGLVFIWLVILFWNLSGTIVLPWILPFNVQRAFATTTTEGLLMFLLDKRLNIRYWDNTFNNPDLTLKEVKPSFVVSL